MLKALYWKHVAENRQRIIDEKNVELRSIADDAEKKVRWDIAQMMDSLAFTADYDKTWHELFNQARREVLH